MDLQFTYMCNSYSSDEINFAVRLNEMHFGHDTTDVSGKCYQNFDSAEIICSLYDMKYETFLS